MVEIKINDKSYQAEPDQSILEVAQANGIEIPTLCYHKDLTPYGSCRLCLIEITGGGRPSLQASCCYKVSEGLEVKTDTERVKKARKIVFELLMARSPDSEQIKELAAKWGVTGTRIELKKKDSNCILCGLCVRACAEVSQRYAQTFQGRGVRRCVGTPLGKIAEACIGCGACAYLCPTRRIKIEAAE